MTDNTLYRPGAVVLAGPDAPQAGTYLLIEKGISGWQAVLLPDGEVPESGICAGDQHSIPEGQLGTVIKQLPTKRLAKVVKALALDWSRRYARLAHSHETHWIGDGDDPFVEGENVVPYAGRVYNDEEIVRAVDTTLDFWLTLGKEGEHLEKGLADFLGIRKSLLAVSALTSNKLPREKRLLPGDEIITCASGFPTTVAPIIQNKLVPVFIDNDPVTLNPRMEDLEAAYSEGKTKAVIFAHAMGNPFDLSAVLEFCRKHDLWLIEDNCDSLGSRYSFPRADGTLHSALTGSFGDISTQSFYPPHHLTMGEGGAVNIVRDMKLKLLVESFRDWGRDCWCPSGKDNTCRKRFGWQLGELPEGYDHKYIYSHLGYNLKPLDIQAAIGRVQLDRIDSFISKRRDNWNYLRAGLDDLQACFEFALPVHASGWSANGFTHEKGEQRRAEPSWFGFMMLIRDKAGFGRPEFSTFLDRQKIGNRALFGGNMVRQPAMVNLARENPAAFRIVGNLRGSDEIMNKAVFVGVYPGLSRKMLDYIIDQIHEFCKPYVQ